ncbi:DegV family protein [Nesterenkonia sp. HG001]|uniref:DegV family protein n=1 Tax=Nesterenkonia sp. HG001 TaxID=2983207 RepID=UPI002AC40085|nr:DegV family protein [Nesterenkonia sp. HG001]MDZ5077911.1 DegV family protein [Nesterenkonia sp. HG001]
MDPASAAHRDELLAAWIRSSRGPLAGGGPRRAGLWGARRRRGGIAVVTDSSCSLPSELLEAARVPVVSVPIPVMIGEQIYTETAGKARGSAGAGTPGDQTELDRDLALAVAQGITVRTSRPSPGRLAQAFTALQEQGCDGIVAIHLSSKLSGTVDAARLAAGEVDIPVRVVDSLQTGAALGHAVLDAAAAAGRGAGLEGVAETAEHSARGGTSFFVVPSLEQLRRGGRINALASLLGGLLWVKPLLGLQDGEVQLVERPRTMPRAMERLMARVEESAAGMERPRLVVHAFGNASPAVELADQVAGLSSRPVPVVDLPPSLAAHLGLGALAVCLTPEPG